MKPTRLFCRLGKSVLAAPSCALDAVERLEDAGVGVFFGGLPAPYGTRASCRRHGLIRVNGYREAIVCARRKGTSDGCLEQAMMELEPHLTNMPAMESDKRDPYFPSEVLSGKLMWWCGLDEELAGPGLAWLQRMRKRLPWFEHGLWPTGYPEQALGVAVDGMMDGADAVMCAGPGITKGAPLERVAFALSQAGMSGIDAEAVSRACKVIMERSGISAPILQQIPLGTAVTSPMFGGLVIGRQIHSV